MATSRITEKVMQHLDVAMDSRSTPDEWSTLLEDMIVILQGENPTWRISKDMSIRGFCIQMSSEAKEV